MVSLSVALSPSPSVMVAVAVSLTRLLARLAYWSSYGALVSPLLAWSISWYCVRVTTPLPLTVRVNTVLPALTPPSLPAVEPVITPPF